jgi:protein-tyrosine kinase
MDTDGRRVHLIERAAVQLDRAVPLAAPALAPAAVAAFAERVRPSGYAATAVEQERPSVRRSGLVIERSMLERAGVVDWDASSSRVAEEFRIVCLEVLRGSLGPNHDRSNLIMITSALPGEGKSFTALNLAVGLARSGQQRVLLVDADGKTGSLSDLLLDGSDAPGLTDLAADRRVDASDLIVQSCINDLEFLPFGSGAANRAEVLGNLAGVIEELGQRVDGLIVIDAPPCLSTSRPHLLAPIVGKAVLVVAAASTQQNDIEAALGLIRSCPAVSLLLNKVSRWNAHSFGSYAYSR